MNPLISVIVPVYNSEIYLRNCIDSILNQTYSNFELILIDDGSSDGSGEICKEYSGKDKRIKFIETSNRGPGEARNQGLDISQGEYISFIDSDDFIEREYLNYLIKIRELENCDLVISGLKQISDFQDYRRKIDEEVLYFRLLDINHFIEEAFIYWWYLGVVGRLYKRDIIGERKFIATNYSEDFEFNLNYLLKSGRVAIIEKPETLYIKNNNPNSLTHKNSLRKANDHLKALDSILQQIPVNNNIIKGKILEILFGDLAAINYMNKKRGDMTLQTFINHLLKKYRKYFLKNKYSSLKRIILLSFFLNYPSLYGSFLILKGEKINKFDF